MFRSLGGKD